jgi:glycosyltransferase involved in cell wall biosynthesis
MAEVNVVIACYNGAKHLPKTLESLANSTLAQDRWRLIFVNNNSTDNTKEVALNYEDRLPITVIDALKPGKSNALNAAIPHLDADFIIFTDDDAEVAPDWMEQLLKASREQPDYDVFTGKIIGKWEKEPDAKLKSWIPLGSTYAIHEREDSGPCDPGKVWGPNMACRRKVFDSGLRFNPLIGPQPIKPYPMGQDTEFAKRAYANGHTSYYTADAKVTHLIKAETINEDWVIRRAERLGYGLFAEDMSREYTNRISSFLPTKLDILFSRIIWTAVYPFTFLLPRCKHRFWLKWRYFHFKGLWNGYQRFVLTSGKVDP